MKQFTTNIFCAVFFAAFTVAPGPTLAQSQDGDVAEGIDLLSEGTKLLLRGLMGEFEPALRELEGALSDLNAYHAPEVLPNGDILIRRKTPKPLDPVDDPEAAGEIDL